MVEEAGTPFFALLSSLRVGAFTLMLTFLPFLSPVSGRRLSPAAGAVWRLRLHLTGYVQGV
jgi:hypothetical protein